MIRKMGEAIKVKKTDTVQSFPYGCRLLYQRYNRSGGGYSEKLFVTIHPFIPIDNLLLKKN